MQMHAIYKALNSSNEILRMEAQIALVRLSDDNPFEFLSHLTRPFSLWEQITLHELMIQHQIDPSRHLKNGCTSPNPTVVMFALRMIREFKQKDAEDDVKKRCNIPILMSDSSLFRLQEIWRCAQLLKQ